MKMLKKTVGSQARPVSRGAAQQAPHAVLLPPQIKASPTQHSLSRPATTHPLSGRASGCSAFMPGGARQGRYMCVAGVVANQPSTSSSVLSKLCEDAEVLQLYRYPGLGASQLQTLLRKAKSKVTDAITCIDSELCFNVAISSPFTPKEAETMAWLLRETFEPELLTAGSHLQGGSSTAVIEVGPRKSFQTAFSSNAVSIAASCGLGKVTKLEKSRRFKLTATRELTDAEKNAFALMVHDRMLEEVYPQPLKTFKTDVKPAPVFSVPILEEGREALAVMNTEMGLAFDKWDLDYYYDLFVNDMKRNPTNVELFDIAQSNSEHSRHWFFGGNMVIDGVKMPDTLFNMVKTPWKLKPGNSVVAFKDNSSCIRGTVVNPMVPLTPGRPSIMAPQTRDWDLLLTAETHNFPCAVAPFPGAETGAGGRMRDTHATGKGSLMGAGTAGYCTGNLRIDGYVQPHEDLSFPYPENLASPLQILIDASNGASDYGNKFGEPLIAGYCRTYGQRLANGERREWIKPIMFSGGIGQIDHRHLEKDEGEISMLVVKIGGPAYRIGMGGGAASSLASGSNKADLDYNAVQRGDAEMAQKLWRVVRSCCELGDANPIVQIHDQGAGGNCNVVKEIIYPLGGEIDVRAVKVGDETLSVLEIWGAEYQENDAILIKPESRDALQSICDRERCFMQVIGTIDGSGRVRVVDKLADPKDPVPEDLDLNKVLGKMPSKTYEFQRPIAAEILAPMALPATASVSEALDLVLRLPSVCSKRFLTTKVDRHVTGLVAQQQCCGPLQIPVADVAVYAQSHQDLTGLATSIGEQPLKGMISPAAMARLSIGESLTNLVFARATSLEDIRCSINWMYAAKMGYEGVSMWDAAVSVRDIMIEIGIACDGGKDSLSMAATASGEVVMAPGNLVVSSYVGCPDITQVVTPDLKLGSEGALIHIDLGAGRRRLGGSALGQAYSQLGDVCPDVTAAALKGMWSVTQSLIAANRISAGHDISDGGIVTTLCEMAFAGNCGLSVDLASPTHPQDAPYGAHAALFAEELGLILEVKASEAQEVASLYSQAGLTASVIGKTTADSSIDIKVGSKAAVSGSTAQLRNVWEATAFQLERLQAAEECVEAEEALQATRTAPVWKLPYKPTWTSPEKMKATSKVKVAVLREEGSNGDREMSAAVHAAGMEPWDVTMSDLLNGRASLDSFRGVIFVGGFSYADTLDSAKGWSAAIRFNDRLLEQFKTFYAREDTWSLGICNGCQLMALLGWIPAGDGKPLPDIQQPRFVHNKSGRFESRFVNVEISPDTPAMMLKGMGGANIGVWTAHGEGQALFPNEEVRQHVLSKNLAPIRYTDASGTVTEQYPYNPNGSPMGIAALCSENGRHLAMMPHPERCYMTWQLPWHPTNLGLEAKGPAPWLKLFQNAQEWCEN